MGAHIMYNWSNYSNYLSIGSIVCSMYTTPKWNLIKKKWNKNHGLENKVIKSMPKHLSLHHTDMPIILSNYNLKSATHGHGTPNVFTGVRYHHRYYKPLTNSSPLSTCRASVLQKIKRQRRQCLPLLVAQLDSESSLQSSEDRVWGRLRDKGPAST